MKTILIKPIQNILILMVSATLFSSAQTGFHPFMVNKSPISQQLTKKDQLIIAYYGRPGTSKMGILGKYPLPTLIKKVKTMAGTYAHVTGNNNILPALELVHSMATRAPGAYKDHILPLSQRKTLRYIKAAASEGLAIFLDHQLGKKTPSQAIMSLLEYLSYPNVHLALDPEFSVHGRGIRPGKVIGFVTAKEINRVQTIMSSYMQTHHINTQKILLVHMFRHQMLKQKQLLRYYPNIKLIMHLDGHGSSGVKVDIYNSIYNADIATHFAGGFKLFFQKDKPKLMTPAQVMGLSSIRKRKIKYPPQFISYQ